MRQRGFLELTWSIFRFCMRSLFAVLSILYVFAAIVTCLLSPDALRMAPHHFLASLGGVLLFGLVFVSYVTLLLAVPVSAFCALAAFLVTGLMRAYDRAFPNPRGVILWGGVEDDDAGVVEVVEAKVTARDALCPVCAERLDPCADLVSCQRCDAPHHPECWAYIGSCATFGCGSDRSRASSQPPPAQPPEWPGWREAWRARGDSPKGD